jgi:hypothetical protein
VTSSSPFASQVVPHTPEITRIAALPRRTWSDEAAAQLADMLTRELKTPGGTMKLRPVQAVALYEAMEVGGLFGPMRVGSGKCLGRGTPVLMFDGTIKLVEDVIAGDVLMGPDSGPRLVKSTCTGREMLYRIVPVKGEPYVVNESHVLSVKQTKTGSRPIPCMRGGRIRNLTVKEFLGESSWFRSNWKGYRAGVEFQSKWVPEPYILGLWLGDGSSNVFAITTADAEIVTEIREFAARYNLQIRVSVQKNNAAYTYHLSGEATGSAAATVACSVCGETLTRATAYRCAIYPGRLPFCRRHVPRGKAARLVKCSAAQIEKKLLGGKPMRNIALEWLRTEGVLGNKHVPQSYKTNSREVRLEVLAGLLDSDGSLSHAGYDYISVSEHLADDVCFLARSLGLAAYKRETRKECVNNGVWGTYYRVSISGDTSCIPCRIARKKAPVRRQKKSVLMTGIRAEPIGEGDYFGFELEGVDRLFLLGDFTVTHNTLCTALLPAVLEAKRPILLLPAALIEKTVLDFKVLREHWRIATNLQLISYEMLGLVQSADKLNYIRPDLIVADECHMLKNLGAGRTRRVIRYMREHPETKFVGMSGTVMKASVKDFARLLRWALKDHAPIPSTDDEVAVWADALDERVNPLGRRQPNALFDLGPRAEPPALTTTGSVDFSVMSSVDGLTRARRVFQARLLETRGVVASSKTDGVTCSLRVAALEYQPSSITEQHIGNMRNGVKDSHGAFIVPPWTTPDGWTFSEAIEFRMYLRQLALGFHGVWDPRPPPEWLTARRDWAVFVRETLSDSRVLDTELQVANAVDAGRLSTRTLDAWRAIRDTFTIQPKDIWHDDAALNVCATWMEQSKGIVWCEHRFFAKKLSEMTGAAYYGANGLNDRGESITLVKPGKAIIASVQANATGRNLQMFSANLITSCPPSAQTVEQLIGRTHRDGQEADEVTVDILLGCREHHDAFDRALDGARAAADTLGHDQKLLLSDVCMPDISNRRGPLWA